MPHQDEFVEPWLRGTRRETPAVVRAVLHALDLAREDFDRWVWPLGPDQLEEQPFGLPSAGFQARHIGRSLDRLLSYAEGRLLSERQRILLQKEHEPAGFAATRTEFEASLATAEKRILVLPLDQLEATRHVGSAGLAVTLAGLLVHLADHSQRHVGQAVTTAKLLASLRAMEQS